SLPLILYGVVAEVSIDNLFRAGVLPGLLMLVLLSGYSLWIGRNSAKVLEPFSWRKLAAALNAAKWALPLPIVVLGGIYSGFFAVSEAAAVTALYVLLVEVVILREITFTELPRVMRESMLLVGGILIILGMSLASTNYMIDAGVPQQILAYITEYVSSQANFLILLFVFLLILGAILDIFSAIVLVVPLILPIAMQYGVNEYHLGIVFLAAMQLGYLTPPVGLNLFFASYRFERPLLEIYRAAVPFLIILGFGVLLITYVPLLTTGLLAILGRTG
ncbi:MAG: TRAP transporter large permease subunit, partial [Gemmatimonadetes bacterium]|nr:TRAP transporter large permease subunit [Gemmatimonadota bacterium]